MEYRPNTLFAFFKNERAFHGVDPIADAESGARPAPLQHLRDPRSSPAATPDRSRNEAGLRVAVAAQAGRAGDAELTGRGGNRRPGRSGIEPRA